MLFGRAVLDVVACVHARSYVQFVEEETKRDWHWDARHRPELEMWAKVPNALLCEWSAQPPGAVVSGAVAAELAPPQFTAPPRPRTLRPGALWTAAYMGATPVSVLLGGVLPAALAWILWDDWYWRPMFLTWLILAPAKFGPPFNWWWLWPGLL